MTWYADEIVTNATPDAIAWAKSSPLVTHAYVVKSLDGHGWHTEEIKHDLPPSGLLFIQPVCGPGSVSRNWYGRQPLAWNAFSVPDSAGPCDGDVSRRLLEYLEEEEVPTPDFRRYLAAIADRLAQTVVFYSCGMWGGSIDYEYALVYSAGESFISTLSELTPERPSVAKDSLRPALNALGVRLPTGYFAPHTRSFPWSVHRLA